MASGKLKVKPLISHRFPLEKAKKAYALIAEGKEPYLGILLRYGEKGVTSSDAGFKEKEEGTGRTIILKELALTNSNVKPEIPSPVIGMIGAGGFTGAVLLPALQKTGARLKTIASSGGVSGTHLGRKFGVEESTTDADRIFSDPEINAVVILRGIILMPDLCFRLWKRVSMCLLKNRCV